MDIGENVNWDGENKCSEKLPLGKKPRKPKAPDMGCNYTTNVWLLYGVTGAGLIAREKREIICVIN